MKTTLCKIVALPKVGDDLRMNYTTPVGGRTEACLIVTRDHFWRRLEDGESTAGKKTAITKTEVDEPATTWVQLTEQESVLAVTKGLAQKITDAWGNSEMFSARAKGDLIIISCQRDEIVYYPTLNGTEAGGRKIIEVEE